MGILRWKWVRGYKGLYRVSDDGKVKSVERNRLTKGGGICPVKEKLLALIPDNGYFFVRLCKNGEAKKIGVHQLVARAFIPNPENKPEVNHIDTIKTNNHRRNLEWNTRKENADHASRNGLLRGNETPKLLTKRKVWNIRRRLARNESRKSLAMRYQTSYHTITDIALGRTWKRVNFGG